MLPKEFSNDDASQRQKHVVRLQESSQKSLNTFTYTNTSDDGVHVMDSARKLLRMERQVGLPPTHGILKNSNSTAKSRSKPRKMNVSTTLNNLQKTISDIRMTLKFLTSFVNM